MIRKTLAILILISLTACTTASVAPKIDCPREGGIGGTGDCDPHKKKTA